MRHKASFIARAAQFKADHLKKGGHAEGSSEHVAGSISTPRDPGCFQNGICVHDVDHVHWDFAHLPSMKGVTALASISTGALSVLILLQLHEESSFGAKVKALTPDTNCSWPYLLDHGSPDEDTLTEKLRTSKAPQSVSLPATGAHAGLFEIPVTTLIIPPDAAPANTALHPGYAAA